MNLPGRVGAECERKWKELAAAGKLLREDRFDYMQWYERQRVRMLGRAEVEADQPRRLEKVETGSEQAVVEAVASTAVQADNTVLPAVISRKRVGAPPPPPAANKMVKSETVTTAPASVAPKAEAVAVKQETAAVEPPKPTPSTEVKAGTHSATGKKEPVAIKERVQRREREIARPDVREQPPRKKTARFQQSPQPSPPPQPAATLAANTRV